ncbi:MAG: biotin/lipoyl-binding protein, partial [Oscillospiraceae bacterium]|nr:biotin/lipoyl-binding protein [Oscillospiraceae bacterium]
VLKGETPVTCRPGELLAPADFEKSRGEMKKFIQNPTERDVLAYNIYPKVFREYCEHIAKYGAVTGLTSHVFFDGLDLGETTSLDIEDGKTLVIKYLGLGDVDENGMRTVQFELNGMRREVSVADPSTTGSVKQVALADPEDKSQVGASIPGMIAKLAVAPGDTVEENQVLAVVEAMKMEINIAARMSGVIDRILVSPGQAVKAGELLIVIK